MDAQHFELLVEQVPYDIKAVPFEFNSETRFLVSYNEGPEYVFVWDSSLHRLTAIGEGSETIPDDLELAIAEKLQSAVS